MAVYTPKRLVRFEVFELDLRVGELRRDDGRVVRLPEQPFRILTMLLEHPGEVVGREEIGKKLWPNDTIVEFERSISAAMNRCGRRLTIRLTTPVTSRPWRAAGTGCWCRWNGWVVARACPGMAMAMRPDGGV